MATWITHLRIAENLLNLIPDLEEVNFAVGNIAPDSGIPDEKWEKFTPPSEITHFAAPSTSKHRQADLEFYRLHLAHENPTQENLARYSFLWGYFCHLVTDNLWSVEIGRPTYERYKTEFDANHSFIWEVKKDWYGLDFEYVQAHPDSLYWQIFLDCSYPVNFLDFLLPEGVQQRIEYIQTYYREINDRALERINHPRIYLTMPEVNRFVDLATTRLYNIYNQLRKVTINTNGYWSVLELVT